VQVAKTLGARKVIVTSRDAQELEALRSLGADVVMPSVTSEARNG
jgi:NADPH:quinone reductase-like Zn-dependent oxidoreductase